MQTNEGQVVNGQQLELTLDGGTAFEPAIRGRISQDRAAWWFDRIHSRLRRGLRPVPPARHEQERLDLGNAGGARWCVEAPRWGSEARAGSQAFEHAA
jgi:hypothetical protein